VRAILGAERDIEVVGEAADGKTALGAVSRLRPDVLMTDIAPPRVDGIEMTRALSALGGRRVRVVILTTRTPRERLVRVLRAGAQACLLKDAPPAEIVEAVRLVAAGHCVIAPAVAPAVLDELRATPANGVSEEAKELLLRLTSREREVLALLVDGRSNAEIAHAFTLTDATVRSHVHHVLTKLRVRDRCHLVAFAYETGLVGLVRPALVG
jgi:DNA-binding NarL/FixJ family response regulator